MQTAPDFTRVFGRDRASATMGVRTRPGTDGEEFLQDVVPRLKEDPTGTSVCTYGAMIDACVGSAAIRDPSNDQFYVGSRLSLNWTGRVPAGGVVTASSRLLGRDTAAGTVLAAATIRHDELVLGHVTCRGVAVGTTDSALVEPKNSLPDGPEVIEPGLHSLGLDFLTPVGRDEPIRGVWAPEPWMENGRGTVQGGIVLAVVGEIAESVGARFVRPGRRASLMDVDVSILGAPTTDSNYDVACRVIRAGRRIGVMEIEIVYGERHFVYASAQVLIS